MYSELFTDLISPMLPERRDNWDNMSHDIHVPHVDSPMNCVQACEDFENCMQSLYKGGECYLGTEHIILGIEQGNDAGEGNGCYSTWNASRIAIWVSEQDSCAIIFPLQWI